MSAVLFRCFRICSALADKPGEGGTCPIVALARTALIWRYSAGLTSRDGPFSERKIQAISSFRDARNSPLVVGLLFPCFLGCPWIHSPIREVWR